MGTTAWRPTRMHPGRVRGWQVKIAPQARIAPMGNLLPRGEAPPARAKDPHSGAKAFLCPGMILDPSSPYNDKGQSRACLGSLQVNKKGGFSRDPTGEPSGVHSSK
eukprot:scaffold187_cov329-Pavlova_lutheri.AAC.2